MLVQYNLQIVKVTRNYAHFINIPNIDRITNRVYNSSPAGALLPSFLVLVPTPRRLPSLCCLAFVGKGPLFSELFPH